MHRSIDNALNYYSYFSEKTADKFWSDLNSAFLKIAQSPGEHHFDSSGLRRANPKIGDVRTKIAIS